MFRNSNYMEVESKIWKSNFYYCMSSYFILFWKCDFTLKLWQMNCEKTCASQIHLHRTGFNPGTVPWNIFQLVHSLSFVSRGCKSKHLQTRTFLPGLLVLSLLLALWPPAYMGWGWDGAAESSPPWESQCIIPQVVLCPSGHSGLPVTGTMALLSYRGLKLHSLQRALNFCQWVGELQVEVGEDHPVHYEMYNTVPGLPH